MGEYGGSAGDPHAPDDDGDTLGFYAYRGGFQWGTIDLSIDAEADTTAVVRLLRKVADEYERQAGPLVTRFRDEEQRVQEAVRAELLPVAERILRLRGDGLTSDLTSFMIKHI